MEKIYSERSKMRADFKFQSLAEELIRVLRDDINQRTLSYKLGFSFNQIGKWESGSTKIKWDDFLDLIEILGIPFEEYFRHIFWTFDGEFTPTTAVAAIIRNQNIETWPWPRAKVAKWRRGDTVPLLADVLQILYARPAVLFSLLSKLVDCTKLSTIRKEYDSYSSRMEFILDDPNCVYVNAALGLKIYQDADVHDEKLLALHSACTVMQLRKTLETLLRCEIISQKNGKYLPCPFDFSFSSSRNTKVRALTKYTTDLLASRYSVLPTTASGIRLPNSSVSSVRVVAMSAQAAKKTMEMVQKFHSDIAHLVAEDKLPKDGVQILLVHSVDSTR